MVLVCVLTGCQKETESKADAAATAAAVSMEGLADYLAGIKEQSDAIKASLEKDGLTQTDMNQKSRFLRELWEGAMSHLLAQAQKMLPEAELAQLTTEQTAWEADKIAAVQAAGKEYEGGTMYALTVNSEAAKRTEERVYQVYEMLK